MEFGIGVEKLYLAYGRSVFRRARSLLADVSDATDACQEVFLKVMHLDDDSELGSNPLAWLYRTTTNLCLNRLRDEKRRRQLLDAHRAREALEPLGESRAILGHILRHVPGELKEAAIYYYVDGMSHDEIANVVGSSRRTVGNRLVAFHARMEDLLKGESFA